MEGSFGSGDEVHRLNETHPCPCDPVSLFLEEPGSNPVAVPGFISVRLLLLNSTRNLKKTRAQKKAMLV